MGTRTTRAFLCGVALATLCTAANARAQTAAQPEPEPDRTAQPADARLAQRERQEEPGEADGQDASEIVVTARTRAESLGDVPIAGAVLSGQTLQDLVVDRSSDLVNQLPATSLVLTGAEYNSDISIRGQGVGRLAAAESTTGIYRNGVYIGGGQFGGRTFNRMDLFDVQRVESFRGPQGALYGRNAVGGSINIVSNRPAFELEGRVRTEYRFEIEAARAEGVLNLPLSDIAALRLGAIWEDQNDGFHHDLATGRAVDRQKFWGARAGLRIATGGGELNITVETSKNNPPSVSDIAFVPDAGDPDPFTRANLRTDGYAEIRETSLFMEWSQPFSFGEVRFSSNMKRRDGERLDDIGHVQGLTGFNPLVNVQGFQEGSVGRYTADLRILSGPESRLQWLIGADVQGIDDINRTTQNVVNNPFPVGARRNTVAALSNDRRVKENLFSWSVFGLLGYDITTQLNASVELRHQADEKSQRGFNFRPTATTVAQYSRERSFDALTPVATLSYRLGSNSTAYARFATGYRPGGFNDQYLFQGLNQPSVSYDLEYTRSYELGWKGNIFGNALYVEAAAFMADTDNVQLISRDPASGSTAAQLLNAGDSRLYGVELSTQGGFRMGPGRLNINGSVTSQWGDFKEGSQVINNQGTLNLSGRRVPRTRDYIGNLTLSYILPVGGGWRLTTIGNVRAEGGGFENLAGSAGLAAGRTLRDFVLVNGRLRLANERFGLSAFVKNVFDKRFDAQAISVLTGSANFPGIGFLYLYNEPRSFGLEASVRF